MYLYLVLDPDKGSINEDRLITKELTGQYLNNKVIKAGVGNLKKALQKYSKDKQMMGIIIPIDNPAVVAKELNNKLSSVIGNGTPDIGKNYLTPAGIYRFVSKAGEALQLCPQQLGRWCNHNHREISIKLRKARPELFKDYQTFKEAGFGKTG